MSREPSRITDPTLLHRSTTRRGAIATVAGLGLWLPTRTVLGQEVPQFQPVDARDPRQQEPTPEPTSPPIEPIDQEPEAPQEQPVEEEPAGEQPPVSGEADVDYDSQTYFAQTGHNLAHPFYNAWEEAGGEEFVGLPLSEARFVTDAGIQQVFETLTLGYDPSAESQTWVYGVPIAADKIAGLAPASAFNSGRQGSGGQFFSETGHGIVGKIQTFWNDIDGERFLGKPLSEEYSANGRTRQVFENAVVELQVGKVNLARVVVDELLDDATLADPAFAPAPPTLGVSSLVTADNGLFLRGAPSANGPVVTTIEGNAEFIAAPGDHGDWVPGYVDGFSGWVSAEYLSGSRDVPTVDMRNWDVSVWQGAAAGETNVRAQPSTGSTTNRTLAYGDAVTVVKWVEGEAVIDDDDAWAELSDGTYVYVRNVIRTAPVAAPPLPNDAPSRGRWIDVHLTQQLMVAYDGREVQRVTVMTSGRPGWSTPEGMFAINTRVANETMESGSIGAESFYVLKDVLYTQYFTDRGHALHFAWWKNAETIGRPGSHGCLNLLLDDAKFYWDWATVGTPVYCHY